MLVLSRRIGESLRIDEDITVTVLESRGNRVRLGIDAPKDYEIIRGELVERRRQSGDSPSESRTEMLEPSFV